MTQQFPWPEVGKGSGPGLARVYGFLNQSGGGIRIDPVLGEGTSIKIYLPRDGTGAIPVSDRPDVADRASSCSTRRIRSSSCHAPCA